MILQFIFKNVGVAMFLHSASGLKAVKTTYVLMHYTFCSVL